MVFGKPKTKEYDSPYPHGSPKKTPIIKVYQRSKTARAWYARA
jgi:hypothetical protein